MNNNKYKLQKYYYKLNLLKGGQLEEMPQLCVGSTVNVELQKLGFVLKKAIDIGYRHFDSAESYGGDDYRKMMKEIFKYAVEKSGNRHNFWITWKTDNIDETNIKNKIKQLDCEYIDLLLIHNGCGDDKNFEILKILKSNGLIKHYGVSNCENIDTLIELKQKHNIYAVQNQARPPGIRVFRRDILDYEFYWKCHTNNIRIMFFGLYSGFSNIDFSKRDAKIWDIFYENQKNIFDYYLKTFIPNTKNVLIIGSNYGNTLEPFFKKINEKYIITNKEMKEFELVVKQIEPLANQ